MLNELPRKRYNIKKQSFARIFAALDIEVSSIPDRKIAIPYIGMVGIGSQTCYARTMDETIKFIENCAKIVYCETGSKLLVWVHNLGYEWQHMKHYLSNIIKVFARSTHDVIEIETSFILFRCSYAFTRLPLSQIAKNFTNCEKLTGSLDYDLVRHPETPLTFEEFRYCFYDIEVLRQFYENELVPNWLSKRRLPMTSTGKVREAMRRALRKHAKENGLRVLDYNYYIQKCQLTEQLYDLVRKCFWGAYTHADIRYVDQIVECDSFDFGSSYPFCILTCDYPMTPFKWIKPDVNYIEDYCCCMEVELYNVTPSTYHHPLSKHKMLELSPDAQVDNGRIIAAKYIKLCCCDVDWKLIKKTYHVDSFTINKMCIAEKGKLPKFLRKEMMQWYNNKNALKNVKGKEVLYNNSKEYVNSIYGLMVMDILIRDIELDDNLVLIEKEIENKAKRLRDEQSKKTAFTLYQWGVYVTAHARYNLFNDMILPIEKAGGHVVYSDTDSAKTDKRGMEKILAPINERKKKEVEKALSELGLPEDWGGDLGQACKENEKPFLLKTLGAKRYAIRGNNNQKVVVSGLSNTGYQLYIRKKGVDMFDDFTDGLHVTNDYSGRTSSFYTENVSHETIVDYLGEEWSGDVYSGICISKAPFSMKLAEIYETLIQKERRGRD